MPEQSGGAEQRRLEGATPSREHDIGQANCWGGDDEEDTLPPADFFLIPPLVPLHIGRKEIMGKARSEHGCQYTIINYMEFGLLDT
jgi:hypothetical protein